MLDPIAALFEGVLWRVVRRPDVRLVLPQRIPRPPRWLVLCGVLLSYFMVLSGIVYDVTQGPPSMGQELDSNGKPRPVAILKYRINGQFIIEGFTGGFMFLLGGMGIILLNFAQGMRADASVDLSGPTPARGARLDQKVRTKQNSRVLFLVQVVAGVVCIVVGFFAASKILVQKVPNYLS